MTAPFASHIRLESFEDLNSVITFIVALATSLVFISIFVHALITTNKIKTRKRRRK